MHYEIFQPHPALRPYVSSLYYFKGDTDDSGAIHKFRFPSDGGAEMIVNLGDPFSAGSCETRLQTFAGGSLIGPLSCHLLTRTAGQTAFVAVRFRPGGLAPFFDVLADQLTDQSTALDAFWGPCARRLLQRVHDARTPEAATTVVQSTLRAKHSPAHRLDRRMYQAAATITASKGLVRVGQLARMAGLSRRQFERRFRRLTGLSPKRLCRIVRFANLCAHMGAGRRLDWVQSAMACGYSDQAHMIRECRFFTGHSPEAYLQRRSPLEAAILESPEPMSHLFNTSDPSFARIS